MPRTLETQPTAAAPSQRTLDRVLAGLSEARERTLELVAGLSDQDLERSHSPLMSPLVWDLAHIAAYEDLWLAQRLCGLELLRGDLAERYDAFETPRAVRADIEILDAPAAREYLSAVRERVGGALGRHGTGDGVVCEMVIRHELQHTETMRQTLALAGLLPAGEPALAPLGEADGWVQVPAGTFEMGAGTEAFAYDNERPRHPVELAAFQIARNPVSNAAWTHFAEQGGYARRELWSADGWEWKRQHAIAPDPSIAQGDPRAPVCHVSWYEADAFARFSDARLPAEAEWERAATGGGAHERAASDGDGAVRERAGHGGDGDRIAHRASALAGVGQVWEWTRSAFGGYPGFRAHPYREYSEVFFGKDYRVLRGSSWATAPRVASLTFRNWDLPVRRQIFAGVRLARDVS
jgi:gamma-glutamyl hercynylcysteine S-oxide synthase